jgi:hypothetical protein
MYISPKGGRSASKFRKCGTLHIWDFRTHSSSVICWLSIYALLQNLYITKNSLQSGLLWLFWDRNVQYFGWNSRICYLRSGTHHKFADLRWWIKSNNLRICGLLKNVCLPTSSSQDVHTARKKLILAQTRRDSNPTTKQEQEEIHSMIINSQ